MMTKAETQEWASKVPTRKVVDLSKVAQVIEPDSEHGVDKSTFQVFLSKMEQSSFCGYKWDLCSTMPNIKLGYLIGSFSLETKDFLALM